jgi:hypothetical protein
LILSSTFPSAFPKMERKGKEQRKVQTPVP